MEIREVAQFCSGSASVCSGSAEENTAWSVEEQCGAHEVCTAASGSAACEETLECVAWCDRLAGLCWNQEVQQLNFASAEAYCDSGTWAGASWRLPTVDEWIGVLRGCNNGTEGNEFVVSGCRIYGDTLTTCAECEQNQGPDIGSGGCYWVPDLEGPCEDGMGYWSSTPSMGGVWIAHIRSGFMSAFGVLQFVVNTRCVTEL